MDAYRTGVTVTGVNLTDVQLPDAALAAQRDAEKAAEDRQRTIADAQAYANDIVPKAQAAAQRHPYPEHSVGPRTRRVLGLCSGCHEFRQAVEVDLIGREPIQA